MATPASNNGLLVKLRDEAAPDQRAMFLSSEARRAAAAAEAGVTYLEPTPESTYYAPTTPGR